MKQDTHIAFNPMAIAKRKDEGWRGMDLVSEGRRETGRRVEDELMARGLRWRRMDG